MIEHKYLRPFTKWVGGKRKLLPELYRLLPHNFNRYYEPFVGGGAMLFSLAPNNVVINDMNSELINAYRVIKDCPHKLIRLLKVHARNNCKDYFLRIRKWDRNGILARKSAAEKAARFMYMLRVDFNGMYRVNRRGQFNVSYGRYKNPKIVNSKVILADSKYLNRNHIDICNGDFSQCLSRIKSGDFVYFDPPYIPLDSTANFTSYTSRGFSYRDHKRLSKLFFELSKRDVYVMLSNSDTKLTKKLYRGAHFYVVYAGRAINSNKNKRGKIPELVITNY